jgi:signal transduction histidine kinase
LLDINQRLEEFAYTTSHDLKSPLNSVQGLVYLLKDEWSNSGKPGEQVTEMLNLLENAVYKMRGMIDGILEYSRLEAKSLPAELIDLEKELRPQLMIHEMECAEIHIQPGMPVILYNKVAFFQIMDNLVNNAIKFCDKPSCRISIKVSEKRLFYIFSVSDNGPGVEQKNHQKIFELFMRLNKDEDVSGSGIGLATVKKLVENFGGKIWIDSESGKGACFSFTVPKA